MSDVKQVLVPDVGGEAVEVIELCVAVGDTVAAEDAICTVETDKASMDIPAPFAGTVTELKVNVGDKISQDDLIALITIASDSASQSTSEPAAQPVASNVAEQAAPAANSTEQVLVPDVGGEAVEVIELSVAVGDTVAAEDAICTVETDKASMDIPAPFAGTVAELNINVGDKISQGDLIALIATSGSTESIVQEQAEPVAAPAVEAAPAPAPVSTVSEIVDVSVPDIGQDGEVDVIDVLVNIGDTVAAEDGLITLETDKATMDVPSPLAGTVANIAVNIGDKVGQGSLVLTLKTQGQASSASPVQAAAQDSQAKAAATVTAPQKQTQTKAAPVPHHPGAGEYYNAGNIFASPSIRRTAREFGVDLHKVKGTGRKGRILKEDVQSFVKYELSRPKATAHSSVASGSGGLNVIAPPKVDFSKFGEVEVKPLTRIQKISGPNLHRNWVTIPHVTQFDECDITDVEAFRKEQNALNAKMKTDLKITPLVFIMKAAASALCAYPVFNSSLSDDGESIVMKKYVHIGVAVDTPNGLVVPVVRDVDKKGINQLSQELMEISKKARDGKLTASDMQGSCFTISSLGGIGGTAFTPIVNAPDVAILGVSKSEMKPKWSGSEFLPRLMLPLSLSYDHRVIDGAVAARFIVHLSGVMADIRRLTL
jgi:pyruvate dehydrogenase E2 component (dihydrolipoamide acetyltransferase)